MSRKNFLAQLEREPSFAPISFGYRKMGIQIRYQILYAWIYLMEQNEVCTLAPISAENQQGLKGRGFQ